MKNKILGICAVGTLLCFNETKAQFSCAQDHIQHKLELANPKIKIAKEQLNEQIAKQLEAELKLGHLSKTTATEYTIPIVVHVIHDYGSEYVSDNDIFEAVDYWDKVFNKQNADTIDVINRFKNNIGNAEIRLKLATIDPSGKPTKGITRRWSQMSALGSDEAKLDYWPNNKYINVWIVNKFKPEHSGAAAYAYYPSSAQYFPHYDGIIGVYNYLNYDKAIPHEFGHVLNLAHVWGDSNNPGVSCGDDYVSDTPPTMGHTSCGAAQLYDVTCSFPDTNNTQNIMDYAYCQKMFTHGQVARMRASLTNPTAGRNNLITAANIVATGAQNARPDLPPIADFSVLRGRASWGGVHAEKTVFLCEGSNSSFGFYNRSWNDTITAVQWNISNGASNPTPTDADINVYTKIANPGWVTVSLRADGNNTGSNTITKKAVYVASSTPYKGGYNQYFESEASFENWPMFNNYENGFKWEFHPTAGYPSGGGSIRYKSFDSRTATEKRYETPDGDYDDIYTPGFDLTSITTGTGNVNLNFYTAGASITSNNNDSLQILISTNCGDTWIRLASLKGADLKNNGLVGGQFVPTSASQWKGQTINIPETHRKELVYFRFKYFPTSGGNNVYLDNFTITPWSTDIAEIQEKASEIKLYPNPSNSNSGLYFTMGNSGKAKYIISDLSGRKIYEKSLNGHAGEFVSETIDRSIFSNSGVYIVQLVKDEASFVEKLTIQ
jgi:hypothetical protein